MELKIRRFDELQPAELYALLKLRVDVFVVEHHCPYPELDDLDQAAFHVWYEQDGKILAYARVLAPGARFETAAIGRVIAVQRGSGLGLAIVEAANEVARKQYQAEALTIEAQLYAQHFYEKAGYVRISEPFDEDGIPHILMRKEMNAD